MVDLLVRDTAVVLEDVVVVRARGGDELLHDGLLKEEEKRQSAWVTL